MKCSAECPLDAMKAIGKACAFIDRRDEENSCKLGAVVAFVAAEEKRQKDEAKRVADMVEAAKEIAEKRKRDDDM